MLKFSAEQLAALGCKTHEEAAVKLLATQDTVAKLQTACDGYKLQIETANTAIETVTQKLAASETALAESNLKIVALENATKTETLTGLAKQAATEVLGASGAPVHGAVATNPTGQPPKASTADALVAEGKFAEAWSADAKLQEQFVKPEHYAQYMKAAQAGRVFSKS